MLPAILPVTYKVLSTYQRMLWLSHSTAYTWKSPGVVVVLLPYWSCPFPLFQSIVPRIEFMVFSCSMMSISPLFDQGVTCLMLFHKIQKHVKLLCIIDSLSLSS